MLLPDRLLSPSTTVSKHTFSAGWGSLEELLRHNRQASEPPASSFQSDAASLGLCLFPDPQQQGGKQAPREIISDKCLGSNGFQTVSLEALGSDFMSEEVHPPGRVAAGLRGLCPPLQPTQIQFYSFYLRFYVFICLKNINRLKPGK